MDNKVNKKYSIEFKKEAVRRLEKDDINGIKLASELGIRRNLLYKWKEEINKYGVNAFPGKGLRPKKETNVSTLNKQIVRLKEEIQILKKILVYSS